MTREQIEDKTWEGAVAYVRDMAKTIRNLTQRFVADGAIAELATVRAEALEECADGMERAAKKARAALPASAPAVPVEREAHGYLSRLLVHYAPQCEPLPDLMGLCSQIDNLLVGLAPPAVSAPPVTPDREYPIECNQSSNCRCAYCRS